MRNVRVLVAYDGSCYHGWQRQSGFPSVQEELEGALATLVGEPVSVHGSGRTDTGVHALGQVASFHLETRLDDTTLRNALNAHLPSDVVVRAAETCPDDFHARFSARGKRYAYAVTTAPVRSPFARRRAHSVRGPLDTGAMQRAAAQLLGRHDFRAFAGAGSPRRTTVRSLQHARWIVRRERLVLVVQGDGFLYNMVRNLAGTLLEVGRGKLAPEEVGAILAGRDRRRAGPTAPAHGLYLLRVLYPEPVFAASGSGAAGPAGSGR